MSKEIDWDALYYVYCVIMNQSEDSFYRGSISKIVKMINLFIEKKHETGGAKPEKAIEMSSMKAMKQFLSKGAQHGFKGI